MTDTATTSYPEFPLCLTAKPSNTKWEKNQNKAADGFTAALCIQEGRMSRKSGQSVLKLPLH